MAVILRHKSTVAGLVTDLDNFKASVGLSATFTYIAPTGSNYLDAAISVIDADLKIDTAVGDIRSDIGTAALTTTAQDLNTAINELDAELGPVASLTTTDKTSAVAAINELDAEIGTVASLTTTSKEVVGAINELDLLQGDTDLTTTANDLTTAVNELDAEIGDEILNTTAGTVKAAINEHGLELGTVSGLTTSAGDLAAAVNELDAEIGSASLTTSAQTLVGAINELDLSQGDVASVSINDGSSIDIAGMIQDLESVKLDKSQNLADINDAPSARANLDVDSSSEVDTKITNANLALGTNFSTANVTAASIDFPVGTLSIGDNLFFVDDGDTKWAIYKVTSVTDGSFDTATTEKIMDEDVYLIAQSKESIKASYESNPDTNAFTDEEVLQVGKLGASSIALTTTAQVAFSAINELDAFQGDATLTTTAQQLAGAVNELDQLQGNDALTTTAGNLTSAINELDSDIGNPAALNTVDKSSTVAAINEHGLEIGDLSSLTTTAQSNIVASINEVDALQGNDSLTTNGNTLTAAVNELDGEIGNLVSLTTTVTSDVVGAINEVNASKLAKTANLSDLDSAPTARTNLDVYSKQETEDLIQAGGAVFHTDVLTVISDQITVTHEPKNGMLFNFGTVRHTAGDGISYDIPTVATVDPLVFGIAPDIAGQFDGLTVVCQYACKDTT